MVATALAAYGLTAFIAIGTIFLPRSVVEHDAIGPSVTIAAGSGITAFVYAVLTRLGFVDAAIVGVMALSAVAIVLRYKAVRATTGCIVRALRDALSDSAFLRAVWLPIAALLWVYSIAPPRDGDVMRYHLAHIRQIIRDGKWETIPDYHYAFPFGWTLNYLPFERLHIPQAAALVNAGLWVVIVAGLLHVAKRSRTPASARLLALVFFFHPFVIRTFASAMADGYAILAVFSIAVLLLNIDEIGSEAFVVLGFVSWIGVQSRYQHIAWGVAATIIAAMAAARRNQWRFLGRFGTGAAVAVFLALPFYVANARGLGDPFWPLLVPQINGTSAYSDKVAASYTAAMTGSHDTSYMLRQWWELFSEPTLFPLGIAGIAILIAGFATADRRYRRVALLGALFLLLWTIAEPKLFPRHVLLLLPVAALLCMPLSEWLGKWQRIRRLQTVLAALVIIVFISISAILAGDYARYAISGDEKAFHSFTWYYRTYDWVNRRTPPDSRFLVMTYSGHSYYLDRSYRRADPWLSGVVDWPSLKSGEDLVLLMKRLGFDYIIYDNRDWRRFPGGAEMQRVIKDAASTALLRQVNAQREMLYTSRAMRDFEETTVFVYRLADASPQ